MRWIIGDVHGMFGPLEMLLEQISREDSSPRYFFAGDYVNRGPDSRKVVDLLLTLNDAQFCRGNHDDTFDLILSGKSYAVHQQATGVTTTFDHFLKYGLDQTLLSYGIDWTVFDKLKRKPTAQEIHQLLADVPPIHRDFFRNLEIVLEEPEFYVAHAKWDIHEPSGDPSFLLQLARSLKLRHEVLWGRFSSEEVDVQKDWERTGFFGHTPVSMYRRGTELVPVIGNKVVLLDTACAINLEGRLTGWCFEENRYIQVHRDGKVLATA